jgi:branched-chain amino acid transport system substrate-binding protein
MGYMEMQRKFSLLAMTAAIVLAASLPAEAAEKKYGPGVTDTEIKTSGRTG